MDYEKAEKALKELEKRLQALQEKTAALQKDADRLQKVPAGIIYAAAAAAVLI